MWMNGGDGSNKYAVWLHEVKIWDNLLLDILLKRVVCKLAALYTYSYKPNIEFINLICINHLCVM